MQRFTDLKVWQRAHALVLKIHPLVASFPDHERYVLSSQLRRSAISVPANVAEGSKRRSNLEYAHHLNIAEGSLAETEYLLMLARDLNYATPERTQELLADADELARMLNALRVKVEQKGAHPISNS
jgi:four helix bundle protein